MVFTKKQRSFASNSKGGHVLRINGFYEGGIGAAGDSIVGIFGCHVVAKNGDGIVVMDDADVTIAGTKVTAIKDPGT